MKKDTIAGLVAVVLIFGTFTYLLSIPWEKQEASIEDKKCSVNCYPNFGQTFNKTCYCRLDWVKKTILE